jgi:DNA-binding MarR family transcriptional regulator
MTAMPRGSTAVSEHDAETLLAASKVISAAVAHSLAGVEEQVSVPGLRVLVLVHAAGTMNISAVADALGVNASSASRTCDRLVGAGLLDRRDAVQDRRHVALTLTRRGTAFVNDVMDERRRILVSVVETMQPDARAALLTGLSGFVEAARAMSEHPSLGGSDGTEGHLLRWVV